MSSWVPTTDFEEEIVSLQPDHNFIFGSAYLDDEPGPSYPRPQMHLDLVEKKNRVDPTHRPRGPALQKLNVIATVQSIACTKPLGEQPTIEDWDTDENVARETIAMMRHCGLGPSIELPLSEDLTIPTYPITEGMHVMRNGSRTMPIFFDEKYFKFDMTIPSTFYEDKQENEGYKTPAETTSLSNSSASYCSALNFCEEDESKMPLMMHSESTVSAEAAKDASPMFDVDYIPLDETSSESSVNSSVLNKKAKSSKNNPFLLSQTDANGSSSKVLTKKNKSRISPLTTIAFDEPIISNNSAARSSVVAKESPSPLKNAPNKSQRQSNIPTSLDPNGCTNSLSNITFPKTKRYYTPKELYEIRRKMK